MKSIRYHLTGAVALALAVSAGAALAATPTPNSVKVRTQVFNDCILNTQTVTNGYPSNLVIEENVGTCGSGANRDVWYFSQDGGATKAAFDNKIPYYNAAAKTYIVAYPKADLPKAEQPKAPEATKPGEPRS